MPGLAAGHRAREKSMKKNVAVSLFSIACACAGDAVAANMAQVEWTALAAVTNAGESVGAVEFAPAVKAMDGTRVTIKGFRVPLEVKTHFLLASKPSDCEHCIDGGPESYVEVFAKEAVKPTFGQPLTMTGTLQLVGKQPDGSYYRLVDAAIAVAD
jgi:hypothetical protein